MIANWKDATKELPERRIRVLICDSLGYMQTAYYGCESSIAGDITECWRSDEINHKVPLTDVVLWDNFPVSPFPTKDILIYES